MRGWSWKTDVVSDAAVVVPFDPGDLPGLIWWLEARLGVTESSGAVSAWADQAGVQPDLVQATSSMKPVYSATGFNGTDPGITFTISGGPDHLKTTTFVMADTTTTWSFFILNIPTTNSQNNAGLASFVPTGATSDYEATQNGFVASTNATLQEFVYQEGSLGNSNNPTANVGSGVPVWLGVTVDGVNNRLYDGGVETGTSTGEDAFIGNGTGTGTMALGTRPWNGDTPSFEGTIAAVFMSNQIWSQSNIDSLTDYINSRYGTSF